LLPFKFPRSVTTLNQPKATSPNFLLGQESITLKDRLDVHQPWISYQLFVYECDAGTLWFKLGIVYQKASSVSGMVPVSSLHLGQSLGKKQSKRIIVMEAMQWEK